jgi:hypothetical protein
MLHTPLTCLASPSSYISSCTLLTTVLLHSLHNCHAAHSSYLSCFTLFKYVMLHTAHTCLASPPSYLPCFTLLIFFLLHLLMLVKRHTPHKCPTSRAHTCRAAHSSSSPCFTLLNNGLAAQCHPLLMILFLLPLTNSITFLCCRAGAISFDDELNSEDSLMLQEEGRSVNLQPGHNHPSSPLPQTASSKLGPEGRGVGGH